MIIIILKKHVAYIFYLNYLCIDALTHFDATVRYGDGAAVVKDRDQDIVAERRIMYWINHG